MKLFLKRIDAAAGGKIAVVDEQGRMLPNQRSVRLDSFPDDIATVTVTFVVGGDFAIDVKTDRDAG